MILKHFYTISEATSYLSGASVNAITERDIFHLAKSEQLPICFMLNGTLTAAKIQNPDGSIEHIKPDVPIEGVASSLVFRGTESSLQATLVSIIQLDGCPIVSGHTLPVTEHPFRIKQGFELRGFLHYFEVPISDWLFHIDDLKTIAGNESDAPSYSTDTGSDAAKRSGRLMVTTQQNDEIIKWLLDSNHNPKELPVPPSGKAGIKKDCGDAVCKNMTLFSSRSVFNTAWDRLRTDGEIKDAKQKSHSNLTHP